MIHTWISTIEGLNGTIDIKIPKFLERIELLKKVNLTNEQGEIKFSSDQLDSILKIQGIVLDKVQKVDLIVGDKIKIKSMDDLEYYAYYNDVINALAALLFNGVKLGNS